MVAIDAPADGRRLHPVSPVIDVITWLPRMWPLVFVALSRSWGPLVLGVAVAVFAVVSGVRWATTTYAFDGRELVVASGLWNRTVRRAPVDRVQQVDVVRKLRHQALGVSLVQVKLADAGPLGGDITLDVLSNAEAESMKVALEQARRSAVLGDGVAASVPPPPEHELLRVSDTLLAVGGVTGASLLFVPAGVFALMSMLDDARLDDDASRVLGDLSIVVGGLGFVIVSIGVAAVVSVLRSHGYRMARRATDLVIERGLLERRATVVPLARVQVVVLHQNLVRRRLGLASVDVATAGRLTGEGSGSANDSVPVVRLADARAVVAVAMGTRAVPDADRFAVPVAIRRLVRRRFTVGAAATIWVPVVFGVPWSWVTLVAAAAGAASGVPAGRARRHGIGADAVTVESGVLAWRSAVVPLDRVQSWSVTQSPFQRRHGLHHVSIHVSGFRTVRVLDVSAAQTAALVSALRRSAG